MVRLYTQILKFDKQIRFAALVDGDGRILEGGMREGVEPMEPLEKTPDLIARLVSVQKSEDRAEFFGKPDYSVLVHEKIVAMIFRSEKRFVLVTASRKFSLSKVAKLSKLVTKE